MPLVISTVHTEEKRSELYWRINEEFCMYTFEMWPNEANVFSGFLYKRTEGQNFKINNRVLVFQHLIKIICFAFHSLNLKWIFTCICPELSVWCPQDFLHKCLSLNTHSAVLLQILNLFGYPENRINKIRDLFKVKLYAIRLET